MSLTREASLKHPGPRVGDMKIAAYNITFTANQLVEPTTDTGWYLLNGAVLSQASYPVLFARFGSSFNVGGEGAGNFRLPDFTDGKVAIAKGLTNFTTFSLGGGEINHALASGEMPAHGHSDTFDISVSAHSHSASSTINGATDTHFHSSTQMTSGTIGTSGAIGNDYATGTTASTTSAATHTHTYSSSINATDSGNINPTVTISAAGSGTAHNNMQPYMVMGGWLVRYG